MQVTVTFRHLSPDEELRSYVERKLSRMDKYFYKTAEAEVILSVEKHRHRAEVILKGNRTTINGTEEKEDMHQAIDLVIDRVERQVKKHKSKARDRKHRAAP